MTLSGILKKSGWKRYGRHRNIKKKYGLIQENLIIEKPIIFSPPLSEKVCPKWWFFLPSCFFLLSFTMDTLDMQRLTIENEGENLQLCLVGRFLTDRPIRVHIMKDRMAGVWRPLEGVTIRELKPGLFLIQFYHRVDVQRVLKGGSVVFQ